MVAIDIGCGANKRNGFQGVDCVAYPGVDHVVDFAQEPLPFPDRSVDHVYSAHCLEHLTSFHHLFREIGRVCKDGAKIEIITPYAWSNDAFILGHVAFLTELVWQHLCVHYPDDWKNSLGGRWLLNEITYIVAPDVKDEMARQGIPMAFALRYLKNVALEFRVDIEYRVDMNAQRQPVINYSHSREGERFPI